MFRVQKRKTNYSDMEKKTPVVKIQVVKMYIAREMDQETAPRFML
jgi:hypothetical protein